MSTDVTIEPALRSALTDTVTAVLGDAYQQADPEAEEDRRHVLIKGLERALVAPDYLRSYLRHLDGLIRRPLPDRLRELLPEDLERQVLDSGLTALDPQTIDRLAISPYQITQLRRVLLDEAEIPTYWVDVIEQARERSAREAGRPFRTAEEIVQAALRAVGTSRKDRCEEPELAIAAFGIGATSGQEFEATKRRRTVTWETTLAFREVEILSCDDPEEVALLEDGMIGVAFVWRQLEDPTSSLTVRLRGALVLGSGCIGHLFGPDGAPRGEAAVQDYSLSFGLSDVTMAEQLEGWSFQCDYHEPSHHVRFTAVLHPPAKG
jgi:hypothetical protein